MVGIVRHDQRAGSQPAFQQGQDVGVQRLGAVQQHQVDALGQVGGQRLQRIALAQFHQVRQPGFKQMVAGQGDLGRLEFGGDQPAAAVVAQRRRQVQRRNAERGAEFDDGAGLRAARQHVQQGAGLGRHRQRQVLHAAVELAVFGLAAHQPRLLGVRHIGQGGVGMRPGGVGLGEQAVQQRGQGRGGQGVGHDDGFPVGVRV